MKLPDSIPTDDVIELLYAAYAAGKRKLCGEYLSLADAKNLITGESPWSDEGEYIGYEDDDIGQGSENLARWQNRGGL